MKELRYLALVMTASACLSSLGNLPARPVPIALSSRLTVDGSALRPGDDEFIQGATLSDGRSTFTSGFFKRSQVNEQFGRPPRISWETGYEYWCYRLPPDERGQRYHFTVAFNSFMGLDEMTHFELSQEKKRIFDEACYWP